MKRYFSTAVLVVFAALIAPLLAFAQAYPSKAVRVIVVFPPGGSNDVVARIVFQKMSEQMGHQFVIDNRGGAAGTIGSEVVANSPPDGYTIMVQSTTHVANAHLYKKLPYDVLNDFVGITTLARQVGMLVVHPALPVKTGKEFVALAKRRPGEIVYGSAGNGSYVHLSMALLASMMNLQMIHVPYKGRPRRHGTCRGRDPGPARHDRLPLQLHQARPATAAGGELGEAGRAVSGRGGNRGVCPRLRVHGLGRLLCAEEHAAPGR